MWNKEKTKYSIFNLPGWVRLENNRTILSGGNKPTESKIEETLYPIHLFQGTYDKKVLPPEFMSWKDIKDTFSKHDIIVDRDKALMYCFASFKRDEKCGCVDNNGKSKNLTNHCCSDNVLDYYALVLDYDGNGATIEFAKERFKEYTYLGYTSANHKIKGVDKFRIILPFSNKCPVQDWYIRREEFIKFAGEKEVDHSTIARARLFYAPCCTTENKEFAEFWSNEGKLLDWNNFTPLKETYKEYTHTYKPSVNKTNITRILDKLYQYEPILDNIGRYSVGRAVAKYLGPIEAETEMQKRWPDTQWNGKYKVQMRRLNAKGPGLNSIKERIRKFEPNFDIKQPKKVASHHLEENVVAKDYLERLYKEREL